jgi:hypothetical protein
MPYINVNNTHIHGRVSELAIQYIINFVKNLSPEDGSHEPKHVVKCNKI